MKNSNVLLLFLLLFLSLLNTSCRKEESVFEGTTPEERLVAGSNAQTLLMQTAMNDGSYDNILDQASCIAIKLPVTVRVNGVNIAVLSAEDFDLITDVFNVDNTDEDILEIEFPATVILADYSEVEVSNSDELNAYVAGCGDENESDDDIECVDIQYPVTLSLFNTVTEILGSHSVKNDRELFVFLANLEDNLIINIEFPVSLSLKDGSVQQVTTMEQLENSIEDAKDSCDEEDNNDVETNCETCSVDEIFNIWSTCETWEVDKLLVLGISLKQQYVDFSFNFQADGNVLVNSSADTYSGTWATSEVGSITFLEINIIGLSDFNGEWTVIDLRIFNEDLKSKVELLNGLRSLRFKDNCDHDDDDDDEETDD